ncbi:MAG TPA: hypothetical protein VK250_04765 [Nitrososphaeraceae archaeon]|nr:hypothetical protein [Nitrososphaeraceae archaeon]
MVLPSTHFGTNNEVFSQMQMTGKDMTNNNSIAMQTGQQMKGMDMGEMMKMMPPHYSKSTYHLMSSVKGIQLSGVDIVNDKELLVKIKSNSSNTVNQNLTLVGGGGDLAGSASVKAGWMDNTPVNVKLQGSGSLFSLEGIHLHLFP